VVRQQAASELEGRQLEKWTAQKCGRPLHFRFVFREIGKPNLFLVGRLLAEKKIFL
jgi:hypothetical protein